MSPLTSRGRSVEFVFGDHRLDGPSHISQLINKVFSMKNPIFRKVSEQGSGHSRLVFAIAAMMLRFHPS
jgi:hypothetical protein